MADKVAGNPGSRSLMFLLMALLLLCLLAGCGGDDDQAADPTPAPAAESTPDPDELAVQWWKWAMRRPEGQDPVTDRSGSRCAQDQPDDVFFLAGTTGGAVRRRCEVPAGRPLFFPVLNVVCPQSVGKRSCGDVVRDAKVRVEVDGQPADTSFIVSDAFEAQADPRSPLAVKGPKTVAAGHYALVEPLDPGKHRIAFAGAAGEFGVLARYTLQIR
jgi:hypothetical protein